MPVSEMIYHSAIIWAVLNLISLIILIYLYIKIRKGFVLFYAIACLLKSLWGLTIPGINIEIVKLFNGVFLPAVAGIFVFFGTWRMYRFMKGMGKKIDNI